MSFNCVEIEILVRACRPDKIFRLLNPEETAAAKQLIANGYAELCGMPYVVNAKKTHWLRATAKGLAVIDHWRATPEPKVSEVWSFPGRQE